MNTKQQGALGVAAAVNYYTQFGYGVFVPVSDVKRYDLIVDKGDELCRVEVKTTSRSNGEVTLRTSGGNQSWSGVIKRICALECDEVFILNVNTGTVKPFEASALVDRSSVRVQ